MYQQSTRGEQRQHAKGSLRNFLPRQLFQQEHTGPHVDQPLVQQGPNTYRRAEMFTTGVDSPQQHQKL